MFRIDFYIEIICGSKKVKYPSLYFLKHNTNGSWCSVEELENGEDRGNYNRSKLPKRLSDATPWIEGYNRYASRIRYVNLKMMLPISVYLESALLISCMID